LFNVQASFSVKGHDNKADLVSRRLDIHPDDAQHLRMPVEMLFFGWMVKYLICVIKAMRRTSLLVTSADIVSVDDDFLTNMIIEYSSCSYFADEKTRWKGHGLIKSSDGFYTYHDRLVIPRPAQDL